MREHWRQYGTSYLVAIAATAGMVLLRWLLDSWMGNNLPLATLYGAVAFAAWFGGYRPALLAVVLGYLACDYLFIEPRKTLGFQDAHNLIGLILYLATCAIIIGLGEGMWIARRQADQQRESLRVTFASIGDAVITTDAAGRVASLNPVAVTLTGWTEEEAAGRPLEEVFRIVNEKTRKPAENPAQRVLAEGKVVGLANHTTLIARDGRERPIDDSAAPIKDAQGYVAGVVLIFRDVTERRQAERSARFLASIVESSNDAIIGEDINGIITSWNQAAERLFGYTAAEAVGQPVAVLEPPERKDEMAALLVRIRQGERIEHFDTMRRARDGRLIPISLTVSPIRDEDGQVIGASKIARDISERKRAEEALRAEKARLHTTLVSIGDAVLVTDAEGRVSLMNPVAQTLTGWKSEAEGRPLEEVFRILNEHTRQTVENPVQRVLAEGKVVGLANHTVLVARDGTEIPIDDSAAPITDDQGRIAGCVLIFRDITARRTGEEALREGEQRLRLALEAGRMGIWEWKPDTNEVTWSPGLEAIHGLAPGTFGGTFADFQKDIHPDDRERVLRRIAQTLEQGQDHHVEYRIILPDGTTRWVEGRGKLFRAPSGVPIRMIGICVDVTERRRAEEALKEADRRKDEFLATLAHELRNPLAPIRTAVQHLQAQGPPDPETGWGLGVIDRQVRHLARLLDDLLDVSRITHGKLELRKERVELAAVVQSAVETSRPLIDRGGLELTITLPPEPVYLDADPMRLAQVFANLLNNAAKYTEPGGHLRLAAERQAGDVVVSVKDDGIGIAADMLPRVFDLFSQARRALERSQGGLGIGLSLVRGLVELHGGSIEARSDGPGKGSEFVVRLSAAPEAVAPEAAPPSRDSDRPRVVKRRILVVDDLRDSADSLALLLKKLGHEVHTAYDGEEAVLAAEKFRPEVVLLDLGMPKQNGYDACRRIRQQPWAEGTYFVALTGWGQVDDRRRTQEAGFHHHLVKPADPAALMKLLAGLQPSG